MCKFSFLRNLQCHYIIVIKIIHKKSRLCTHSMGHSALRTKEEQCFVVTPPLPETFGIRYRMSFP